MFRPAERRELAVFHTFKTGKSGISQPRQTSQYSPRDVTILIRIRGYERVTTVGRRAGYTTVGRRAGYTTGCMSGVHIYHRVYERGAHIPPGMYGVRLYHPGMYGVRLYHPG